MNSDEDDESTEVDDGVNLFAIPEPLQEELYIDDPKKALKGFFEREGLYCTASHLKEFYDCLNFS